jgi:hypothetical protein
MAIEMGDANARYLFDPCTLDNISSHEVQLIGPEFHGPLNVDNREAGVIKTADHLLSTPSYR